MTATIRRPLFYLAPLYFAQGMPFGFQATALPAYLRAQGVALSTIGFLGLLSLPWILKALWAPLVDRFGTYKKWIVPMQLGLGATSLVAAFIPEARSLDLLLAAVFAMNLFAATQDIAVDGLAVRTLRPEELGPANALQVVGYKVGMLTGGGLLVWIAGSLGWRAVFFAMAALMAVVLVLTMLIAEDARGTSGDGARADLRAIMRQLWAAAKVGGAGLLLVTATGKIGEQMIDTMWKPFLVDRGLTPDQIGKWNGTWGMAASIGGSLLGAWACRRLSLSRALLFCAIARLPAFFLQTWVARALPGSDTVIAVTVVEHLLAGMLSTALFAYMMSKVDPRISATHYTLLASVEVLGKAPGSLVSGVVAERVGYFGTFAIGSAFSVAYVVIVWIVTTRAERAAPSAAGGRA